MLLGVNVSSILFFMPKCFHVHTAKTAMLLLLSLKLIFMRPSLYAQRHHNQFWRKTKSKQSNILYLLWQVIIETSRVMMLYLFQIMLYILLSQNLNPRSFSPLMYQTLICFKIIQRNTQQIWIKSKSVCITFISTKRKFWEKPFRFCIVCTK